VLGLSDGIKLGLDDDLVLGSVLNSALVFDEVEDEAPGAADGV
jgi:hypothetical protein